METYEVTRDGRTLATFRTENEAWRYLLRQQGQSIYYATLRVVRHYLPQRVKPCGIKQEGGAMNTTERIILNECHVCGEPHTLNRMVHKWDYSYCLTCWQTIDTIVTEFNKEMETK
jgi:hypothetical protein